MDDQQTEKAFGMAIKEFGEQHDPEIADAMRGVFAAAKSIPGEEVEEDAKLPTMKLRESLTRTLAVLAEKGI